MPRLKTHDRVNLPLDVKRQVEAESHGRCAHCGAPISYAAGTFTVEHVIPLHKGGSNDPDNLVGLCEACNKDKSDDVVLPGEYYPYLSKDRMRRVSRHFDAWLSSTDCLAYDTLFLLDRFSVQAKLIVDRRGKNDPSRLTRVYASRSVRIEKLRKEKASELLMLYAARLSYQDRAMFECDPDKMVLPYYAMSVGNRFYGLLCPHIVEGHVQQIEDGPPTSHTYITLDVMLDQDLPRREQDLSNLAFLLDAVVDEISRTLSRFHGSKAMVFRLTVAKSDELGVTVVGLFGTQPYRKWNGYQTADSDDEPGQVYMETVLFAGSSLDQQALAEQLHGTKSLKTLVENTDVDDIADAQEAVMADVRKSRPIREKPGHIKKRDKKRKRKKR